MSNHIELGKQGESIAAEFLEAKGYRILDRNWRKQKGEIDIIAMYNGELVFIEVKTSANQWSIPDAKVNAKKLKMLGDTAFAYMEDQGYNWSFRIDIVSIIISKDQPVRIEHYENIGNPWEEDFTAI